jgi:hypothetical protein
LKAASNIIRKLKLNQADVDEVLSTFMMKAVGEAKSIFEKSA